MKKMTMLRAGLIALVFTFHQTMQAQWIQTNGPASGDVNAMAVIGTTLFAASTANGVFVSSNNGAAWSPANAGLLNTTVNAFAVNASNLYAGTDRGVFLSTNFGANWIALSNGLALQTVKALAFGGGTQLMAGTDTGGVFFSGDNGSTWSAANTGLENKNVRALVFGTPQLWFAATYGGGVFASTNNGAQWTAVNAGLTNLNVNTLYLNGTTLYAGTDSGGIFRLTGTGAGWTKINSGIGPLTSVRAITSIGTTLFAGTVGMGVYRSTDDGASWTLVQNGLPKINTLCFASIGSNLFAGILGGGVFLSTNNADSWTAVNNGMTTSVVLALAQNGSTLLSGLFRNHCYISTDQGATWSFATTGMVSVSVLALVVSGSTVYAGSDGGAFYTTDNGASWNAINNGLTPQYVSALAVNGGTLLAGTSSGIYRSSNNGSSWAFSSAGLPPDTYIHSLLATGTVVVAGTAGTGVYRSTDNGVTWSAASTGLPMSCYPYSLAVSGATIFAGTNAGVYASTDNGTTWSPVNSGLTNTFVHTVIVNGGTLYAGTDGGVFTSANNGGMWTALNDGLTNQTVNALAVSGSTLYAGTGGSGVMRRDMGPLPTFTIAGTTGIGATTLSYTDTTAKTAVTDGAGNYSITVSYNWTGTVVPSRAGYTFSPASIAYANVRQNFTAQNYSPIVMYTISGNTGGGGETMTWIDGTVKTATASASGAYAVTVPAHWSGTITPSKPGYLYYPDQRSYTDVTANITSPVYSTWRGIMISGNAGAPGVTMSWPDGMMKSVVSDSLGNYTATVSYSYNGTITPSLAGCTFTPPSRTYTSLRNDVANNNYAVTSSVAANVKVFLAGAYSGTAMTTGLAASALIPFSSESAYPASTYGYTAKTVAAIPGPDIVDWVLVELRTGTGASTRAAMQAGFLKSDGTIVDINGTSMLAFPTVAPGSYYVVIYHRNHCAVMSAATVPLSTSSALYDFTTAMSQAYGTNPMDVLPGSRYGMFGGDANRDGAVTGSDYNLFSQRYIAIARGYDGADMNLDGAVTGSDYNIFSPGYIAIRSTQVPK